MGLAGSVHCVAMCGATSAAAVGACAAARPRDAWSAFHLGRLAGYALTGAVAAAGVGALARWSGWSPALRPLWTLLHVAALALGLWLLLRGRQPEWLERLGRQATRPVQARRGEGAQGWQRLHGPVKASAVGLAWFAWPCGLLQSVLVVAALANHPWGGAAVMATFAIASAPALGLGPWLWLRWQSGRPGAATMGQGSAWAVRLAGAMLAGASAWAMGHDLIRQFVAYCVS